jgi:hypothetical protein
MKALVDDGALAGSLFPPPLPFSEQHVRLALYAEKLGTNLDEIQRLYRSSVDAHTSARLHLGLSQEEHALFSTAHDSDDGIRSPKLVPSDYQVRTMLHHLHRREPKTQDLPRKSARHRLTEPQTVAKHHAMWVTQCFSFKKRSRTFRSSWEMMGSTSGVFQSRRILHLTASGSARDYTWSNFRSM